MIASPRRFAVSTSVANATRTAGRATDVIGSARGRFPRRSERGRRDSRTGPPNAVSRPAERPNARAYRPASNAIRCPSEPPFDDLGSEERRAPRQGTFTERVRGATSRSRGRSPCTVSPARRNDVGAMPPLPRNPDRDPRLWRTKASPRPREKRPVRDPIREPGGAIIGELRHADRCMSAQTQLRLLQHQGPEGPRRGAQAPPACTSATPMTGPGSITWSSRSSTTRSTRRWPATAARSRSRSIPTSRSASLGRRTRHSGRRRMPEEGTLGGRGHHDRAARRRVSSTTTPTRSPAWPARRRRLGRQRAVRVAEADDPPRRQGPRAGVPRERAGDAARGRRRGPARPAR